MKIPFNVKYRPQIESGEYRVETKDGKQVRIVSWDKNGFECKEIVALVTNATGTESYTIDGLLRSNSCQKNMNLFIVTPEEELSVFEEGLNTFLFDFVHTTVDEDPIKYVKKNSNVLLSFARQQFFKDGYVIEKKAFHDTVKKVDPKVMKEVFENIDNTERTEFEQELVNFFNEGNAILPDKDGVYNKRDCDEFLHKSANKLLAIAEKELSAKYKVSSDMNGFAYGKGYEDGKKEAEGNLTEQIAKLIKDFEAHVKNSKTLLSVAFNEGKKEAQEDMKEALRIEYERGKADALKDLPRWKRLTPNTNDPLSEQQLSKELENSVLRIDAGGYWWVINREELNKLPKDWVDFSKCV